jgi:hypothetical protein
MEIRSAILQLQAYSNDVITGVAVIPVRRLRHSFWQLTPSVAAERCKYGGLYHSTSRLEASMTLAKTTVGN